jgi:hypothetical protein
VAKFALLGGATDVPNTFGLGPNVDPGNPLTFAGQTSEAKVVAPADMIANGDNVSHRGNLRIGDCYRGAFLSGLAGIPEKLFPASEIVVTWLFDVR